MDDDSNFNDPRTLLALQPFVKEFGVEIVSAKNGEVVVEMPYAERFSTPPKSFPASVVGMLGDVAAVCSCGSKLPEGWAAATLDFTIKMTGRASGEILRAKGQALQAGKTTSVGKADVYVLSGGKEVHCGVVLVTTRNFQIK